MRHDELFGNRSVRSDGPTSDGEIDEAFIEMKIAHARARMEAAAKARRTGDYGGTVAVRRGELTTHEKMLLNSGMAELVARQSETMRLYRATDVGEAFHASRAQKRLAVGGNRGGKTMAAAMEVARAATRQDPYHKYPDKGKAILVGEKLAHCAKVMYEKLFEPDQMYLIRDEITRKWRVYHPLHDRHRKSERKGAPPMISSRWYDPKKDISWDDKKERVPKTVRINTGWTLEFFSGEAKPQQGIEADIAWFDEEIPNPLWFEETLPRLIDRLGRFIWSATPLVGTYKLAELREKAEASKGEVGAEVESFLFNIYTNDYTSEESRRQMESDFAEDQEQYDVRVLGNSSIAGQRIYAELNMGRQHRYDGPIPIPANWTKYVAIDPGRQVAAALFCAVPPEGSDYARNVVFYREVYLRRATALTFARELAKAVGDDYIHGWLIDWHEARKAETGSGKTIAQLYAKALRKYGLQDHGFNGFIHASDDVSAGITSVKEGLVTESGYTRFLFHQLSLRNFTTESKRYVMRKVIKTGEVVDEPVKKWDHLMDCLRYLAMHELRWKPPLTPRKRESWTAPILREKARKAAMQGNNGMSRSIEL